ncbi:hypothetical protein A2U01_0119498, partial [Trifolium medium]|nr:hypothetical protein [Trifolium medium]
LGLFAVVVCVTVAAVCEFAAAIRVLAAL